MIYRVAKLLLDQTLYLMFKTNKGLELSWTKIFKGTHPNILHYTLVLRVTKVSKLGVPWGQGVELAGSYLC